MAYAHLVSKWHMHTSPSNPDAASTSEQTFFFFNDAKQKVVLSLYTTCLSPLILRLHLHGHGKEQKVQKRCDWKEIC